MARTKQTARKIFDVRCVQCGSPHVEGLLERYSALKGRLVLAKGAYMPARTARGSAWTTKSRSSMRTFSLWPRKTVTCRVRFDFEGLYEINDATKHLVAKKFDRVHGKGAWGTVSTTVPRQRRRRRRGLWLAVKPDKRVRRVNVADHLKLKWMLQTCTKSPINKYKNAGVLRQVFPAMHAANPRES